LGLAVLRLEVVLVVAPVLTVVLVVELRTEDCGGWLLVVLGVVLLLLLLGVLREDLGQLLLGVHLI